MAFERVDGEFTPEGGEDLTAKTWKLWAGTLRGSRVLSTRAISVLKADAPMLLLSLALAHAKAWRRKQGKKSMRKAGKKAEKAQA